MKFDRQADQILAPPAPAGDLSTAFAIANEEIYGECGNGQTPVAMLCQKYSWGKRVTALVSRITAMTGAYSSDECDVLAQALDVAWDICRQSGDLDAYSIDLTKAALARSILSNYENGERNTRRLAIAAVAQLDVRPSAPPIVAA
jgi:hypothetical protein